VADCIGPIGTRKRDNVIVAAHVGKEVKVKGYIRTKKGNEETPILERD